MSLLIGKIKNETCEFDTSDYVEKMMQHVCASYIPDDYKRTLFYYTFTYSSWLKSLELLYDERENGTVISGNKTFQRAIQYADESLQNEIITIKKAYYTELERLIGDTENKEKESCKNIQQDISEYYKKLDEVLGEADAEKSIINILKILLSYYPYKKYNNIIKKQSLLEELAKVLMERQNIVIEQHQHNESQHYKQLVDSITNQINVINKSLCIEEPADSYNILPKDYMKANMDCNGHEPLIELLCNTYKCNAKDLDYRILQEGKNNFFVAVPAKIEFRTANPNRSPMCPYCGIMVGYISNFCEKCSRKIIME